MKSYLSVLAVSALLLTGCSTPTNESKPEYDAVELAIYKSCLDASYAEYIKPQYRSEMGASSMIVSKRITGLCEHLKPVKK
jgi:PBP1b-binding outer membrane lipoprotein LpoB